MQVHKRRPLPSKINKRLPLEQEVSQKALIKARIKKRRLPVARTGASASSTMMGTMISSSQNRRKVKLTR